MASKLPKYTLVHNEQKKSWDLKKDGLTKVKKRFDTKSEATKGGVLKDTLGSNGGSVKIQKITGQFEEERTYPRDKDPKSSKG